MLQQSHMGWCTYPKDVLMSWSLPLKYDVPCTAGELCQSEPKKQSPGYWNEIHEVACHPDDKPLLLLCHFFFLLQLHFIVSGPYAGVFLLSLPCWCCLALLKICISICQAQIIVLVRLCNLIGKIQLFSNFFSGWNLKQKFATEWEALAISFNSQNSYY